jgi:hypothetical protein
MTRQTEIKQLKPEEKTGLVNLVLPKCEVTVDVKNQKLFANISFETSEGERGNVIWTVARECISVAYSLGANTVLELSVNGDYHQPDCQITENPEMLRRILDLNLMLHSAVSTAVRDQSLSHALKKGYLYISMILSS